MVENRPWLAFLRHAVLIGGVAVIVFPVYVAFVASSHDLRTVLQAPMPLLPGERTADNFLTALTSGPRMLGGVPLTRILFNSLLVALVVAAAKIAISLLSAFAVVYFRFPLRMTCFWTIFLTLMLPVEVRILATYAVVADLGMLNSYAGLTVPLLASATATFLFRQFFMTVPDELVEAARMDGAGPLRFLKDVLLPLSATNVAALFVILFIYGWNQYLWPLLITTETEMSTIVIAIGRMLHVTDDQVEWPVVMATALLALLPPVAVVLLMQRWFVKGLVDSEK